MNFAPKSLVAALSYLSSVLSLIIGSRCTNPYLCLVATNRKNGNSTLIRKFDSSH